MERERAVWRMLVTVLADEVEYLRFMATQQPHMSTALRTLTSEAPEAPEADSDFRPYLTEEEEELLALRLNEHIDEQQLRELQEEIGKVIPLPDLEPDE